MDSQAAPSSFGTACANHEHLPAAFICRQCNTPICDLCAVPQDDGGRLCPACTMAQTSPAALRPVLPVRGQKCQQHPNVAAVHVCRACGAPVCATCDFLLPGNLHYCPACATASQPAMSPKRKKTLVSSFVMAGWCTFILALLLGGAFRSVASDAAGRAALGYLLMLILILPAIAGVALGVSSKGRSSATIATWIAILWNGMILGGFVLLIIIGMMMKG